MFLILMINLNRITDWLSFDQNKIAQKKKITSWRKKWV